MTGAVNYTDCAKINIIFSFSGTAASGETHLHWVTLWSFFKGE